MLGKNEIKIEMYAVSDCIVDIVLTRKYDKEKDDLENIKSIMIFIIVGIDRLAKNFGAYSTYSKPKDVPIKNDEIVVTMEMTFKDMKAVSDFLDEFRKIK